MSQINFSVGSATTLCQNKGWFTRAAAQQRNAEIKADLHERLHLTRAAAAEVWVSAEIENFLFFCSAHFCCSRTHQKQLVSMSLKALRLDSPSHVTSFNQSECICQHSVPRYAMLKFVYDIGSLFGHCSDTWAPALRWLYCHTPWSILVEGEIERKEAFKEKKLFSSWTVQLTTTKVLQMAFENLMLISSFDG